MANRENVNGQRAESGQPFVWPRPRHCDCVLPPGFRQGTKVVVVDGMGRLLDSTVVPTHGGQATGARWCFLERRRQPPSRVGTFDHL